MALIRRVPDPRERLRESGRGARRAAALAAVGLVLSVWMVASGCGGLAGPDGVSTSDGVPTSDGVSTTAPPSTVSPSTTTTTIPYATTTVPSSTTTTREPGPVDIPDGGMEVVSIAGAGNIVALTFDAAYDPAPLGDILKALTTADVPGTFFLTGEFAEDFPDQVAAIKAAGFPIGNHSFTHPDFTKLDTSGIRRELDRTREALAAAGASDPRPLFRFPYGARNARVLAEVGVEGYVSVYWTIDTLDWKPERTPAEVEETILSNVAPGSIILMHVGSRQTAEVLPRVIAELKARGFGFVDLRSALSSASLPKGGG
ncbi:MAG: polysaccharide deacetylase family protein [Thermoleophilia bacterium]